MNISIFNEYDPLKTVIIGNADHLYFPDSHAIEQEEAMPFWKRTLTKTIYRWLRGKRVPQILARKFQIELEAFEKLLKEHNVEVLNVDPIIPDKSETFGLGQMYARDSVICIGERLLEGNLQIEMRKKELRGYQRLINEIGANVRIETIMQTDAVYLEGGDVLVDYPNIFVGIGKYASNLAGVEWLKSKLDKGWQVIPIFLNDDAILHLDCCLTIIGPKMAIIHCKSLKQLPDQLKDYTFIEIDDQTRKEMGGNVLVIGNKKIIVQERHKILQKQLTAQGFTVLTLSFTWHALLDGAFRCASCPIERLSHRTSAY